MNNIPNVFEYLDFRKFLSDFYNYKKKINPNYSYRLFARKAGFRNQGFFIDVVKGRKKLSNNAIKKMIKGLELSEENAKYFKYLVAYSQAKENEEKELILERIIELKSKTQFYQITKQYSEYYLKWYNPIVREIIAIEGFNGDYKSLCKKIFPKITVTQAKKSIKTLESLAIIEKDPDKGYKTNIMKLRPDVEELRELIKSLNKKWIEQSIMAIDMIKPEDRYISSLMVALPQKQIPEITKRFEEFKEYILTIANEKYDNKDIRIYQFNFQLFPRTGLMGSMNEK